VPGDDEVEHRLRELLHDPGWSLPSRPDALSRVRKAARRQRLRAAGLTTGAGAVTAALVVLLALLAGNRLGLSPAVNPGQPEPQLAHALPPVGADGFPADIYPAPHGVAQGSKVHSLGLGLCPSAAGVQPAGPGAAAAALRVIENVGRSFRSDLSLSDRSFWPAIESRWQPGRVRVLHPPAVAGPPVLFSGPLESYDQAFGPPDLATAIQVGCGSRIASDTWMIVTGAVGQPARQREFLLLDRHGRMLLWKAQ
jgi:hypothetical protein